MESQFIQQQQQQQNPLEEEEEESLSSSEEALLEMLGLESMKNLVVDEKKEMEDVSSKVIPSFSSMELDSLAKSHNLPLQYQTESMCIFPQELSVSAEYLRTITEELVWGGDRVQADRTYETIQLFKHGEIQERRTLTRLENFVDTHEEWSNLCHGYLSDILSVVLNTKMVLFKEKLNLKPPGGSGFAPHLDTPSLRIALGDNGPQTFCTVMVAIDDMTIQNGCLRLTKGPWSEQKHVDVIQPEANGNPDAGGRAGAIENDIAQNLEFHDIVIKGGTIVAFNGWAPHRSAANKSPFPRRAVFLTYNPKSEGDYHTKYYDKMKELRDGWREKVGLAKRQQQMEDEQFEQDALATVPRI